MKALPLILTFALLGVNTPFSALPEKPVTEVKDAAEWAAMFTSETMENVTCTTHTVIGGDMDLDTTYTTLREGRRLEYRYEDGGMFREEYFPDSGVTLTCFFEEDGLNCYYASTTPESWASFSSFYLEEEYADRFDEAVYDREDGCYRLDADGSAVEIYAENGRLVKLTDSTMLGAAEYSSETLYYDYGVTVVEALPETESAVNAEEWAFAFSAEGLKNSSLFSFGETIGYEYSNYCTIAGKTASVSHFGGYTDENPEGIEEVYAYEAAAEGVYTYREQEDGWIVTSLDSEITWEAALLNMTGLNGFADAFEGAEYDADHGCYTFTMDSTGCDVQYTVFFINGVLDFLMAESENGSYTVSFSFYPEGSVNPEGPFYAEG